MIRGQKTEDRGQRTEDGRQRMEDRGQRTEDRGRRMEDGGQNEMKIETAKELTVYCKAYELAMEIFKVTKSFPADEKYALISQIRRSSRSVPMNLREAWSKRRYEAHFVSKLTDCDGETNETDTSLDFARDCQYITIDQHDKLTKLNREVGRMLGAMINNPQPFLINTGKPTNK